MKNIEELLTAFSEHGVCATGQRWLRGKEKNMETLVHVWRRWPEYLFEHYDFAIGLLRNMLSEEEIDELAARYLFVGIKDEITIRAVGEPIYLLGDSDVTIRFNNFGTARVYCYGDSKLKVIGDGTSIVMIDACNKSKVVVEGDISATIFSYDESTVEGSAKVIKRDKDRGEVFNGKEMDEYDTATW